MLIFLTVVGILNFLMMIWIVMILNDGFSFTNKNVDNLGVKSELLVTKADEVIAKYKRIMVDIENSK